MDSNKTDGYMVTDREGMLQVLRGLYCSFEKACCILQFVTEHAAYTDKYIHLFASGNFPGAFYYKMKAIPEWY